MDSSLKSMVKNSFVSGGGGGVSSIYNLVINFSVGRLLGKLETLSFGFICFILCRVCSFGKYLGNTIYLECLR